MLRYIVKIKGYYLEWSSVVESPVTEAMSLEDFKKYYEKRYGSYSMQGLESRLKRVEKQGTSCSLGSKIDEFIEISILNGYWKSKEELINSLKL